MIPKAFGTTLKDDARTVCFLPTVTWRTTFFPRNMSIGRRPRLPIQAIDGGKTFVRRGHLQRLGFKQRPQQTRSFPVLRIVDSFRWGRGAPPKVVLSHNQFCDHHLGTIVLCEISWWSEKVSRGRL